MIQRNGNASKEWRCFGNSCSGEAVTSITLYRQSTLIQPLKVRHSVFLANDITSICVCIPGLECLSNVCHRKWCTPTWLARATGAVNWFSGQKQRLRAGLVKEALTTGSHRRGFPLTEITWLLMRPLAAPSAKRCI